jgi:hypothetical protein
LLTIWRLPCSFWDYANLPRLLPLLGQVSPIELLGQHAGRMATYFKVKHAQSHLRMRRIEAVSITSSRINLQMPAVDPLVSRVSQVVAFSEPRPVRLLPHSVVQLSFPYQ